LDSVLGSFLINSIPKIDLILEELKFGLVGLNLFEFLGKNSKNNKKHQVFYSET
jgi:hypothetical protein